MAKQFDPVKGANDVLAYEAIARLIKNIYDACVNVGFSKTEALELAKHSLAQVIFKSQQNANKQPKGKSHGTGNI